jgi:hypothetical protein
MPRSVLLLVTVFLCGCASHSAALRKSQWVLALFRNDTDHDVTIWVLGESGMGGFVASSHKVREDEIGGGDHHILVLRDIGPNLSPPAHVIASCKIAFHPLFERPQYLPASSPKRHLYFRISPGSIEQVSSFEGHKWKIDMPFSGPDYEGAIAKSPEGLTRRCSQPLARVQPQFLMTNTRSFQSSLALTNGG